jgi:signal transduction histidine kinase
VLHYASAVLAVGIALSLKLLLVPLVTEDEPFLLFFAAILASAVLGGLGPGLLATAIASLTDNYFFVAPFYQFGFSSLDQKTRLALFVAEGIFISIICARLKSARQRAEESEADARELEKRILEISDAEQRRIGHDLHDGLGQQLTGMALMARRLQKHLSASGSAEADDAATLSELTKTAVEFAHDLCRSLEPAALESDGLPEALRELAANAENIFKIECSFEQSGPVNAIDLASSVHLYRIAQEAISNAVRHGEAKNIQIQLQSAENELTVRVIDDGLGISSTKKSADGMGLRIMQYRAKMIGASIDVRDRPGGGTVVTCNYVRGTAESGNGNL